MSKHPAQDVAEIIIAKLELDGWECSETEMRHHDPANRYAFTLFESETAEEFTVTVARKS